MSLSQRDSTMALGMAGGFISVAQRSTKTTMLVSSLPPNDTNIRCIFILFSVMMWQEIQRKWNCTSHHVNPKLKRQIALTAKLFIKQRNMKIFTTNSLENLNITEYWQWLFQLILGYCQLVFWGIQTNDVFRRKRPEVLVAVLQELIRRKCIDKVLVGRKETEVCSLLRFIGRNFADMNWQPVLIEVLGILIENYQDRIRYMVIDPKVHKHHWPIS